MPNRIPTTRILAPLALLALLTLVAVCGPSLRDREVRSAAPGPLRVHPTNPRYFTDGSGRAVYLTGSHTWCNLANYSFSTTGEVCYLDWPSYLTFLIQHNHNFIRMWTFELLGMSILPWSRSGPGTADDGNPKVNLNQLNQAYFDSVG
jgi:hypothetical protein